LVDFLSPAARSERMSRIPSSNTSPELALRRALHALGFRFRLHRKDLPGKPDIALSRYRTVVFVHGCFWHRHAGCNVATTPKSNTSFWVEKFDRNVARDTRSSELLEAQGWKVIIAWECELGSGRKAADTALRIAAEIRPGVLGQVGGRISA
jgi:DNA mismatch endonuclease (patch repair protein)